MNSRFSFPLSVLLAGSILGTSLFAQNITGTLTGVVLDQTGANVAGAKVVATASGTRIAYTTTTKEAGVYVLPALPPGTYEVTVENTGFKKSVRGNLSLSADQRLRVDFALELGSLSENVVVAAEAALVQTEQANLGLNFEGANITRLPVGRSPFSVLPLIPGVGPAQYELLGHCRRGRQCQWQP
jgi:hypothetical protein